jgi:phage shock protein PspC (stress-responsive transcriptional regulator)
MKTVRLTRSMLDRVLGGVCGGMASYLGVEGWWLRILWIALAFTTPLIAVFCYMMLWFMIPGQTLAGIPAIGAAQTPRYPQPETILLLGFGTVGIGVLTLVQINGGFQGFNGDLIAPILLLLLGVILLIRQIGGRL